MMDQASDVAGACGDRPTPAADRYDVLVAPGADLQEVGTDSLKALAAQWSGDVLARAELPRLGALIAKQFLDHPDLKGMLLKGRFDGCRIAAVARARPVRIVRADVTCAFEADVDGPRRTAVVRAVGDSFNGARDAVRSLLVARYEQPFEDTVWRASLAAVLAEPSVSGAQVIHALWPWLHDGRG